MQLSIVRPFYVNQRKPDRVKFLVLSILANKLIDQSEELEVLFCERFSVQLCYSFVYATKQKEIKQTSHAPKVLD